MDFIKENCVKGTEYTYTMDYFGKSPNLNQPLGSDRRQLVKAIHMSLNMYNRPKPLICTFLRLRIKNYYTNKTLQPGLESSCALRTCREPALAPRLVRLNTYFISVS